MSINTTKLFKPSCIFSQRNYAVLLLNGEFKLDASYFKKIWNRACYRHTVDGGSNNFHKLYENFLSSESPLLFPHVTSGDFDSIEPDVYENLEKNSGTTIVPTMDQNATDFTKGLEVLMDYIVKNEIKLDSVVALAENSGRLDHTLANINTLHKSPLAKEIDLYILSAMNLTWLLQPQVYNQIVFESNDTSVPIDKLCGIIPTNGPTVMRSTGLKWELNNRVYNFGGMVSTSNRVVQKNLALESDENPMLFTVEMCEKDFIIPED